MKKPTQDSLLVTNDIASTVKELYDLINELASKKTMLLRLSKILAVQDKHTKRKSRIPRVKSNGKN